jgi:hypothetical protein
MTRALMKSQTSFGVDNGAGEGEDGNDVGDSPRRRAGQVAGKDSVNTKKTAADAAADQAREDSKIKSRFTMALGNKGRGGLLGKAAGGGGASPSSGGGGLASLLSGAKAGGASPLGGSKGKSSVVGLLGGKLRVSKSKFSFMDAVEKVQDGDLVEQEGSGGMMVLASSVKKALAPPACLVEGNKVEYYSKRYNVYVMADIVLCDLLSNTLTLMVLAKQRRTGVPFSTVRVPLRLDEKCEVYLNDDIKWFGPATVTKM